MVGTQTTIWKWGEYLPVDSMFEFLSTAVTTVNGSLALLCKHHCPLSLFIHLSCLQDVPGWISVGSGQPFSSPGAPPTSSHPKLSWHSNQMSNLFFPIATPDLSASSHPNILSQHFLWNAPYWGQQYLRAIRVSLMPLSPCFLCVSHTSLCAIPPCGFCFSDLRAFVNVISSIWISLLELTLHLGKYFCLWSSTQLAISRARSPIT